MPPPRGRSTRTVIAFLAGFALALMLSTFRLRIPEGAEFDVSAGADFPGPFQAGEEQSDLLDGGIVRRKNILAVIGVQVRFLFLKTRV